MRSRIAVLRCLAVASAAIALAGCGSPEPAPGPTSLRLVDLFASAHVSGTPDAAPSRPVGVSLAAGDWRAGSDIEGVEVDGGVLKAITSDTLPFLVASQDGPVEAEDVVHAIEVRARISAGRNLEVYFSADEDPGLERARGMASRLPGDNRTPLVPGEWKTYVIHPDRAVDGTEMRHVLLRPSDEAGAEVELESLRVVLRGEHLAQIPSGIAWQGLDEVYRETVVARAPERLSYRLTLPPRPRLDLALGTLGPAPVTFAVNVDGERLFERTVSTPRSWQEAQVDLAAFAGQDVELELELAGDAGELGLWGAPAVRQLGGATDRPQGVLLIVADTLRAGHLEAWGYHRETAPHLTRFAERGTRFTDCIAQATWTKVSFSSFFTGLYPPTHGVIEFHDRLPATATTLAETFREAGYATLSLSSIYFNGKFTNLHQGFEVLHESGSLGGVRSKTARHYVERFLPWLEAHREVPFFAVLHVADPHAPYRPEAPYDTHWATAENTERFEATVEKVVPVIESPIMKMFQMPTRQELEQVGADPDAYVSHELDWYDGSIRGMDDALGKVFERLAELGLDERLVVGFMSDHGTEFLDHDRHWHGQTTYGELSHVPLVLAGPGVAAGAVRSETVQTIDVMPTLLELAGIEVPAEIQGRSLVPLLRGESLRPLPAFTTKARMGGSMGPPPLGTESYSVVAEGYKLVWNVHLPGSPEWELFDHTADPLDQHDIAAEHPQVVERLRAQLQSWKKEAEASRLAAVEDLDTLSAAELERLRSLGYVN